MALWYKRGMNESDLDNSWGCEGGQVLTLPLKSLQFGKDKCDEKTKVQGAMRIS